MDLCIELDDPRPPSQQIVDAILDAVATGELGEGDRLPSVRGLASTALVNPNTVGRAYRELELLEIVRGRSGKGVFVRPGASERCAKRRSQATLEELARAVQSCLRAGLGEAQVQEAVANSLSELRPPNVPVEALSDEGSSDKEWS